MVGEAGHVVREGEVFATRKTSNLDLYAFARGDRAHPQACLLYTSDAADDSLPV